jgi:hypothetical protein
MLQAIAGEAFAQVDLRLRRRPRISSSSHAFILTINHFSTTPAFAKSEAFHSKYAEFSIHYLIDIVS